MNFLAHVHLSENAFEEIQIGNFIADFIKNNSLEKYPVLVQKGIKLHRSIDYFTDHHLVVQESKSKLYEKYHKYAAVIIDVFYDHFLAKNWHFYSSDGLHDLANQFTQILFKHQSILPERIQHSLTSMRQNNWLTSYATLEGIEFSLQRLNQRAKFKVGIEYAVVDLKKFYFELEDEFLRFYPELIEYVNKLLASDDYSSER